MELRRKSLIPALKRYRETEGNMTYKKMDLLELKMDDKKCNILYFL